MIQVSVCCITYNHGAFLAQTIESVLMQETDFAVEMVIGEDCSTDSTRAIALDYAQRYPDRIRVLTPARNLGVMPNLMATMAACSGEFIALVDGDDYWTDPHKLQVQVDALRANPDCAFCFHDTETLTDADPTVLWTYSGRFSHILPPPNSPPRSYTQLDLSRWGWFIPTASMVFRASSLPQPLPKWLEGVHSGDYTLQLLSTRNGSALYLPQIMSRYRKHPQSITSTTTGTMYQFERHIYTGKMFQRFVYDAKDKKHADIYLAQQYQHYAEYLGKQGHLWERLKSLAKAAYYNRQRLHLYLERRLDTLFKFKAHY